MSVAEGVISMRSTVKDVMTTRVVAAGRPETDQAGHDLVERVRHIEGVVAVRDQLTYAGMTVS
jgi:hypothetical protein